jgi:hypothetical protein
MTSRNGRVEKIGRSPRFSPGLRNENSLILTRIYQTEFMVSLISSGPDGVRITNGFESFQEHYFASRNRDLNPILRFVNSNGWV